MSTATEEAVPIVLLGESRRTALLARIRTTFEDWCKHWSSTASVRVAIETAADVQRRFADTAATSRWCFTRRGHAAPAMVAFYRGDVTELLEITPCMTAAELALPVSAVGEMALSVQADISQSFCERAMSLFKDVEVASESRNLREWLEGPGMQRWINISVSVGTGRPFAWLLLHPAAVAVLAPNAVGVSSPPLERRRSAMGVDAAVTLEAVLGDAEVTLADLSALALGDVVVLEQSLNATAQLRTTAGAHVVTTQLGRVDEKRAVTVVSA